METLQAIENRRTFHVFNNKKVPEEIVRKSVEAANQAPAHRLTFPWRFTKIGIKKREHLAQLALKIKYGEIPADKKIEEKEIEKEKAKILNPSHLLIASQVSANNPIQKLEDYAACACAIQNLSIYLASECIGTKWSTGKLAMHDDVYQIVQINPRDEEIIGFIWIGYGEKPASIKRPPLTSVFRER